MSSVRKFNVDPSFTESLHGPFFPSDIRSGDPIKAKVTFLDQGKSLEFKVWRLSPLGVELENNQEATINKGEAVNVELSISSQESKFTGLVVATKSMFYGREIIGIRLVTRPEPRNSNKERRLTRRWSTASQFLPTGMAANPAKFNDFIYFKVIDISANGMQLLTSLRNKFILSGMRFDSLVSFPMISQTQVKFVVKNLRIIDQEGQQYLSLGVEFSEKSTDLMDTVGQYLMQFSEVDSLNELHRDGLSPSTLNDAVTFSYVKTEAEYQGALAVRRKANIFEKKISEQVLASDLGDIYDTRSRIIIGKVGNRIVATGRMTFCDFDQPLENETYVNWDSQLPRRENTVEIMRLATDPEFRGSDLLIQMFRFMAVAAAQSKREWITLCSTDKYLPMYEKMGGHQTGHKFKIPQFNNIEHNLVVGNIQNCILGRGVNPLFWNYLYSDLISYLENYDSLRILPTDRLRIQLFRLLGPISKFLIKHVEIPKKIEKIRLKLGE